MKDRPKQENQFNPSATRRKRQKFNPDRTFIREAVREYIKNGGTVTRLEDQASAPRC